KEDGGHAVRAPLRARARGWGAVGERRPPPARSAWPSTSWWSRSSRRTWSVDCHAPQVDRLVGAWNPTLDPRGDAVHIDLLVQEDERRLIVDQLRGLEVNREQGVAIYRAGAYRDQLIELGIRVHRVGRAGPEHRPDPRIGVRHRRGAPER